MARVHTLKTLIYNAFLDNASHKPVLRTGNSEANRSSFGDNITESMEPITQLSAQYGTPSTAETFSATGGGVTTTDNMFILTTGTSVGGYGVIRTLRPTLYREGQGVTGRFTCIFDSENAVANSLQAAGYFNVQDTVAFGYRGANFGIIHDSYGKQECRTLTITAATSGNLSLILNSVLYTIPLTAGTNAHNAYEIEAWMIANQSVWNAQQIGDTVVFQKKDVGAAAGAYSVSGAGIAGTFSTQATGQVKEEITVLQASWNGEDVSSWFDPSEGNVYMIKISYLGFGPFKFFIMNPNNGEFVLVHTKYNHTRGKPSISNRALKLGWICASLGSTSNLTVKGASCGSFVDGESKLLVPSLAHSNSNASVGTSFVAILTLRIKRNFNGKAALGRLVPIGLEISSDSSKETRYLVVKNATLGQTNYTSHGDGDISLYDTTAHALSSDREVYAGTIGANGATSVDLSKLNIDILLGDTLTIFARVVSGAASNVTAAVIWKEDL